MQSPSERFLASGDESGTAPEDRPFRPDVEGLRAVAVLLVVLFHSGVSALSGGYIGVDVFFVISGFVITGVLMRERSTTGRTSILAFYGRRCRRIIPAATLVIIVAVLLSYYFLGVGTGGRTATDGRWATVFLANFHFSAIGTNYLSAQQPPSPLQNYWSLSVEEQFYVVYPTLFLLLAGIKTSLSLRARLAFGLVLVIGASLAFSVIDTHSHATSAYFSPLTRAWELGLGALVAVATPWLKKVPFRIAAIATWLGFGAILIAAFSFGSQTAYPGSLVTIPVVGAALIIAGGVRAGRFGVEALLGLSPFRWLGKLSYSLYLWHWPILIIAAEYAGKTTLSVGQNLGWDLVALAASAITYVVVENPIRHAKFLFRVRWASIGLGATLVAVALGAITLQSDVASGSGVGPAKASPHPSGTASLQNVLRLVAASDKIQTVPANLVPPLSQVLSNPDSGLARFSTGCEPIGSQSGACRFGDRTGSHTMVLYGDSHAGMWFQALDDIATRSHWKLDVLVMASCPAALLPTQAPGTRGDWVACDQWHSFAIHRINRIDPDLLIVSETSPYETPEGVRYTPAHWQRGLEQFFRRVTARKTAKLVLGNLPGSGGSDCLARNVDDVQACSGAGNSVLATYNKAERRAATAEGAHYVNVTSWFCAKKCSSVIGNYDVYLVGNHVAKGYSVFLEGVLAQKLDLPQLP
ncbi:MAG TPA: acyltransferase family protein [Acidimicrobiales bacterium]